MSSRSAHYIDGSYRKVVERDHITTYTDEYNHQLKTMPNAFVKRYDRNQPLRITLPNTVRLDVMATREYSLVPS